jgi:hypothetical protein
MAEQRSRTVAELRSEPGARTNEWLKVGDMSAGKRISDHNSHGRLDQRLIGRSTTIVVDLLANGEPQSYLERGVKLSTLGIGNRRHRTCPLSSEVRVG